MPENNQTPDGELIVPPLYDLQDDPPVMAERIFNERREGDPDAATDTDDDTGYALPEPPSADGPGDRDQLEQWKSVFLIAINNDGVAFLTADIEEFLGDKEFDHPATPLEMWQGTAQVKKDLEEIGVAQRVLFNMQLMGQAMAAQAQKEALAGVASQQDAGVLAMQKFQQKKR